MLKIDTLEDAVAQIPIFLTRNGYGRWVILSLLISFFLFGIKFSDDLIDQLGKNGFFT